jgi:PEGA domain-containing protein
MRRAVCHQLLASVAAPTLVVIAALAFVSPRGAAAATTDELIKEGVGLRRKGDDLGALQRFEQAYQIDKSPRALAQIGLAEQALGRWAASFEHLTQALEGKSDPWIGKNRATITDALNVVGEHVGRLEILGGSPNAEVRIDGVVRGTLPLAPLTISTGTITIDLSAPGFVPRQRITTVRARQTTRESFDPLVAVAAPSRETSTAAVVPVPPPVSVPVAAGAEAPAAAPPPPSGAAADVASGQPSAMRSSAKWIAWGLGAAALGLGTFGYLRQTSAGDEFDMDCAIGPDGTIQSLTAAVLPSTCRDRKDRVDSNFRLEVIGFVSAAVLAGTGLVLWLTEPKPSDASPRAWACAPGMTPGSGLWMGCHLRF